MDWFWGIIAQGRRDKSYLIPLLRTLSREELLAFHREFEKAVHALWRSPYTEQLDPESATLDDHVSDILGWVVSQGREFYEAVVADPKRMPTEFIHGSSPDVFSGLAAAVYLNRFGELPPSPWLKPS